MKLNNISIYLNNHIYFHITVFLLYCSWCYIFIHYALLVAYVARSSDILTHFIGIPMYVIQLYHFHYYFLASMMFIALNIYTFYNLLRGLTSLQFFSVLQMIFSIHLISKAIEGKLHQLWDDQMRVLYVIFS